MRCYPVEAVRALVRLSYREGETKEEQFRKDLLVLILLTVLVILSLLYPFYIDEPPLGFALRTTYFAFVVVPLAYIYITKSLPLGVAELIIAVTGYRLSCGVHFESYGVGEVWMASLLVMDLLLLINARDRVTLITRYAVMGYVLLQGAIELFDTGIYDTLPRLSDKEPPRKEPVSVIVTLIIIRLFVFYSDFAMTQHFANSMRTEQAKLREAIEAAQLVALALVNFDLDLAEEELRRSTTMNEELQRALDSLLDNLRSYRPFLPDVLFQGESDTGFVSRPPPCGKEVTIAFTDVQSSTTLWDFSPSGMKKAMMLHDRIMRDALNTHNGYEVKTIGDSFMVAFDKPVEAVAFAITVQEQLYRATWPEDILDFPLCQQSALWNGLRVRIGVHCGEGVEIQTNPVTGRADYYGPAVNIASRVEGTAHGGGVAVTGVVMKQLPPMPDVVSLAVGERSLKGVPEPVHIHMLAPKSLAPRTTNRSKSITELVKVRRNSAQSTSSAGLATTRGSRMAAVVVSVAQVRVDYVYISSTGAVGSIPDLVSTVVDCTDRTSGKVISVCSSFVVVAWNVGQSCSAHHIQAARFAGYLKRQSGALWGRTTTVGLSTGQVLYGHVGTGSQRFVMVTGQCIELAGALASSAEDLKTFTLLGAAPGHKSIADDRAYRRATRKVDEWTMVNGIVDVFEVDPEPLTKHYTDDDAGTSWGWSPEYSEAYTARNTALISANAGNDPVMSRVVQLLEGSSHLAHPIPSNSFAFSAPVLGTPSSFVTEAGLLSPQGPFSPLNVLSVAPHNQSPFSMLSPSPTRSKPA